jgi:hypothetical protein
MIGTLRSRINQLLAVLRPVVQSMSAAAGYSVAIAI